MADDTERNEIEQLATDLHLSVLRPARPNIRRTRFAERSFTSWRRSKHSRSVPMPVGANHRAAPTRKFRRKPPFGAG